jgi:hypothetical protein
MNVKELRIGNYLLDGEGYEINVRGLRQNDIIYTHPVFGENCFSGCSIFQPISLTAAWLLNLGFEKAYESPFRLKFDYPTQTQIGYDFSKMETKENMEGFRFFGQYIENVKFIHQLQNLFFALTGEELEVK